MDIESVLLSYITDVKSIQKMWDQGIGQQHFVDPLNKAVWDFSIQYFFKSHMQNSPTEKVLEYEFPAFELNKQKEESLIWVIEALKKRYAKNDLERALFEVARKTTEDPLKAANEMYMRTWEVIRGNTSRIQSKDMSQDILERRERYAKAAEVKEKVRGIPLGIEEIDNHTDGLCPGELAAIAAYTKIGKTFLLCNSFIAMRRKGYTPYFATLELDTEDIEHRIDALHSGFPYEDIRKGTLSRDDRKILNEKQDEFGSLGYSKVEKIQRDQRTVQHIVNRARQHGADCVLIDQLSFMKARERHSARNEEVSELVFDLKAEISEDANSMIPCFLAVQMNRESVKNKNARGGAHNIALSSSIEQTADISYGLSQTQELRANNTLALEIMNFRRGIPKMWLLEWNLSNKTHIAVRNEYQENQ